MPELFALNDRWIKLTRPVPVIQIPEGLASSLPANAEVEMVHELGGDFTVRSRIGILYRIAGGDADAIGKTPPSAAIPAADAGPSPVLAVGDDPSILVNTAYADLPVDENAVTAALKTCFDPEIPVNIVDLGLVYETTIQPCTGGGSRVHVKMTLTAPGCGMGQVVVDDVKRKVACVRGVREVKVELVFYPPWEPAMMSEAARLSVGMY